MNTQQSEKQFNERIEQLRKNISADVSDLKQAAKQVEDRRKVYEFVSNAITHANLALTNLSKAQEKLAQKTQTGSNGSSHQQEQGEAWQKAQKRESVMG